MPSHHAWLLGLKRTASFLGPARLCDVVLLFLIAFAGLFPDCHDMTTISERDLATPDFIQLLLRTLLM